MRTDVAFVVCYVVVLRIELWSMRVKWGNSNGYSFNKFELQCKLCTVTEAHITVCVFGVRSIVLSESHQDCRHNQVFVLQRIGNFLDMGRVVLRYIDAFTETPGTRL